MTSLSEVGGAGVGEGAVPLHRRSIEYEAFEVGDDLAIVGRLRDIRPWAAGGVGVEHLHDLELRVTVRVADLVITDAEALMHTFPHAECPAVAGAFRGLVGLHVGRGYIKEVQRRFGGPLGCTHLDHLARSLGAVVIQSVASRRAMARAGGEVGEPITEATSPWMRDSCHVWAEGGVGEQKVAIGWRPHTDVYPAPLLETLRAEDA